MAERIYAYATFEHYAHHLLPIVEALRDRGADVEVLSSNRHAIWGEYVPPDQLDPRGLWLVAGTVDAQHMSGRRFVYVERGSGQTYDADERTLRRASFSSGRIEGEVVLFLCPNEFVAARRRRTHPDVEALVVGVPKLDHLHAYASGWHEGVEVDTLAFAWHWDQKVIPETRSAWEHWRPKLVKIVLELRRRGIKCVATAHPRIARQVRWHSERSGMEWWDQEDVLTRAGVLAFDNTSLGYEFASLDRPTVVLNAPWYRRDVHHGLRFWECLPGYLVDRPLDLPDAVTVTMEEATTSDEMRACVDRIYPLRDGLAAQRAAEAVLAAL